MSKFKDSREAIDTSILLWGQKSTQTAINETYDIRVNPLTGFTNEPGSIITFVIPPQPKGLLTDVDIVCQWRVVNGDGTDLAAKAPVSTVNNIASAMWSMVDVKLNDRTNIMQSMNQSYNLQAFFDTVFNTESNRAEFLYAKEMFLMDQGRKKSDSESIIFYEQPKTDTAEGVKVRNKSAGKRAERIALSRAITTIAPVHCNLFKDSKALVPNINIRIDLTRNTDEYMLLADNNSTYKLVIDDIYLKCTFIRPQDFILPMIEEKLSKSPAIYGVDKGEIITRNISTGIRYFSVNDIFHGKIPKAAFFCVKHPLSLTGTYHRNPFTNYEFSSFQMFINNQQHFIDGIKIPDIKDDEMEPDCAVAIDQLYKAIDKEHRGNCLINLKNYQINHMVGTSLTADRTHTKHYNLQEPADVRIEIDFGKELTEVLTLVVYCIYDRIIKIDANRGVEIIE